MKWLSKNRVIVALVVLAVVNAAISMMLMCRCGILRAEVEKLRVKAGQERVVFSVATNDLSRLELDRVMLKSAHDRDVEDFNASHKNMGGGRISYSMLYSAQTDLKERWERIAKDWFYATARSSGERKLMCKYGVGVDDLKYSRDELISVVHGWNSVQNGRGKFFGIDLAFTNGVARFYDNRSDWSSIGYTNGLPKEAHLLKENIWVCDGNVWLFFETDIKENYQESESYGSSDSLYELWFARFKGGKLKNVGLFRKGSRDWSDLRFHFEPVNDCIVITSTKTGDVAGELYLALRESVDSSTGKKSFSFGFSETAVSPENRISK